MTAAAAKRDSSPASFREARYWLDKTVDQLLTEAVAKAPDKVSIVADRADRERAQRDLFPSDLPGAEREGPHRARESEARRAPLCHVRHRRRQPFSGRALQ